MEPEILEYMTGRLATPRDTGLKCPITGSRLMYVGYEPHVMDGESFYEAESDPSIKFSSHPFNRGVYYQVERYFVIEDDGSWKEYKRVKGLDGIVPVDISPLELYAMLHAAEEERERRSREYEGRLYAGEITNLFPLAIKVQAKTVAMDLVAVKPMEMPTGTMFMIDQLTEKTKHYVLSE